MRYLILLLLIFSFIYGYSQENKENDMLWVESGISRAFVKKMKAVYVFNGVMIQDSLACVKLMNESKKFKTKIKEVHISDQMKHSLGIIDTEEYYHFLKKVVIKDVIIDPKNYIIISLKK